MMRLLLHMRIKEKGERTIIKYFFSIRFLWGRGGGESRSCNTLFIYCVEKERKKSFRYSSFSSCCPSKGFFIHMLLFFRFASKIRTPKLLLGFLREKRGVEQQIFFSWGNCDAFYNLKLGEGGGGIAGKPW